MRENLINDDNLYISEATLKQDSQNAFFSVIIDDEYVKAINFNKVLKSQQKFYISGNLLYQFLYDLINHINQIFMKIKLTDVDVDDDNKTMLFLRKFSRSSELIKNKLAIISDQKNENGKKEYFEIQVASKKGSSSFTRDQQGNSKLNIMIPVSFVYNRLLSFIDKMNFTELPRIDTKIKSDFLSSIQDLVQNVDEKKSQIDMKYALELAKERIKSLEDENQRQVVRIQTLMIQNDLYKRSYFSLRKRKTGKAESTDDSIEEL